MNVGLFFGSFNPIHIGHLIIANHLVEHSDLDQIWFVVTPHSPHKKKNSLLDDHHRLMMVNIALEDDYPKLKSSNIEFDLPQPSYTATTLIYIAEKYPEINFSLIMGEDNLKSFHKWKNHEIILENNDIYVYPRISNGLIETKYGNHPKIHKIDAPVVEISSTLIRKSIKNSKNVFPLLPYKVWKYIDEMNFYKK